MKKKKLEFPPRPDPMQEIAEDLIKKAITWIEQKMQDDTEKVFNYLDEQPFMLDRMVMNPLFERNWHKKGDVDTLKNDLRNWMLTWQELIKKVRKE